MFPVWDDTTFDVRPAATDGLFRGPEATFPAGVR
jgi:hypothetical protein